MKINGLQGIAASDGIAIGPAFCYAVPDLTIPSRPIEHPNVELARFQSAQEQARMELQTLRENVALRTKGDEFAAIFDAHEMMLDDPMLADKVTQKIQDGIIVEQAVADATQELAAMLAGMKDEYFAAARPMSRMLAGACCASCSVWRILRSVTCTLLRSLSPMT